MNKSIFLPSCMMILLSTASIGQIVKPDLSDAGNFEFANRAFDMKKDDSKGPVVYLKSAEGPGVVWLRDTWFSTGTLEFDVKGKEVLQKSFVGMAFHAQNDSTYEGIYFRPFNFNSTEEIRRSHSVQYIFLPQFDWYVLRENDPGKYENPLPGPVDANDWFHVRISVQNDLIKVYVNENETEVLSVKPIPISHNGKLGFWVGNGSDGTFANLVIRPD